MFSLSLHSEAVRSLLSKRIKFLTCPMTWLRKKPKYYTMSKNPQQSIKYTSSLLWLQKIHTAIKQGFCAWVEVGAWPAVPKHIVQPHLYMYLVHHAIICCPLAYSSCIYLPTWPSTDWLLMFQGFAHLQQSRTYLRSDILSCCVGSKGAWLVKGCH